MFFGLIAGITAQKATPSADIKKLDSYFEKALTDWKVPGMAIAIVKDDKVVLSKGYGIKSVKSGERVSPASVFPIASITKGFTSACMAILVEEKKISWDDPVTKYLPWFELYDPYVSKAMKVKDLFCHRSGLMTFSGDLIWCGTSYSREEVVRRARFLKPSHGFRESFGYSNIMYIAATEIISKVSGRSWDDFVKERFLIPLGMNNTTTSINDMMKLPDVVTAHTMVDDKQIVIPFMNWDNMGGAGALNSNVSDMTRWIMLQLNRGSLDGKTYFSQNSSRYMWQSLISLPVTKSSEDLYPSTHFKGYGLGWSLMDYHGRKVVSHSGGYDGIISYCVLVPEEKLGFIILTNSNSSLYHAMAYKILDSFLSKDNTDWSQIILERIRKGEETSKKEVLAEESKRNKDTKPLPLSMYTGLYGGEMYGNASVYIEEGKLRIRLEPAPLFTGELTHWHYNTFEVKMENFPSLPKGKVNFIINSKGIVDELKIDIPNPDFYFTELEFKRIY